MTYRDIQAQLQGIVAADELRETALWIAEQVSGKTRTEILVGADVPFVEPLRQILDRLKQHEPLQYIMGYTDWAGLRLRVTPAVLIPRPETAELVEWVSKAENGGGNKRVLDIGTGSGCIAIALKKRHPNWTVYALDKSCDALQVARHNAEQNGVEIQFIEGDIQNLQALPEVDVVVSNPPYILPSEQTTMQAEVLQYEPHEALFVTEEDPLLYYRCIAQYFANTQARLYFEINRLQAQPMRAMLNEIGYRSVLVRQDIEHNDRFIEASV